MSSKARELLKMSAIIAVTFSLGLTLASAFNLPRPGVAESRGLIGSPPARHPIGSSGRRSDTPMSFADVVDRVNPSVVYVQVRVPSRQQPGNRNDVPPEFQDFFRRFQAPQERFRHGSGTGFIVSQDGYILTNNHVVADADSIRVKLLDNREFSGRVIGRDPNTDVAVIKIPATGLPPVTLGNSDQSRVGDWVLAFGNPLGFTFTVTAGIVSAKGRSQLVLPQEEGARYSIQDFIQTDAAINPGNSGGPLVNLNGEVVGINTAIASQTGLYSGYGFAIPTNLVRRVMDDLIAKGHVDRAILGIGIEEVTADEAALVGLTEVKGVFVKTYSDDDNSPARRAGILLGDVIVAVNDTAVDRQAQLQQMVGFRHAGEVVRVTVARHENGRNARHTISVRLAAAPGSTETASAAGDSATAGSREMEGRLGLRIAPLSSTDIQRARLTDDQRGVVVADVEEEGPSWGRIAPPDQGPDIILKVNDARVRTPEEFKQALRAVPARGIVQLTVLNLGNGNQHGVTRAVIVRSR